MRQCFLHRGLASSCVAADGGEIATLLEVSARSVSAQTQVVYPDTRHGFYYPHLRPGPTMFGHWVEFSDQAADTASRRTREFLGGNLN